MLCAPAAFGADRAAKGKPEKKGDSADKPAAESMDGGMMDGKSKPAGKTDKPGEPETHVYRFKAEKKGSLGDAPAMMLVLEDMLTNKTETVYAANADPAKYGPVPAVADGMKDISAGDLVEVRTERQRGRAVATSLKKAALVKGEDRPKGFVYLGWDRKKDKDGKTVMALKLRKFGRELVVMVPLTFKKETGDWLPPGDVEYILNNRVQPGEAIEADIKPGNPPVLDKLWEYYPPEKGKFLGLTEMEYQGYTALAIEMISGDGTKLRVRMPGKEQYKNGVKVLMPEAQQLAMVRSIKPDSEIEVYIQSRNNYVLREITVVAPPGGEKSGKSSGEKPSKSDKSPGEKAASAK
jgi:hypothetical protein